MSYEFHRLPCNICGQNEPEFLGVRIPRAVDLPPEHRVSIVRCRSCGLIYSDPMPIPDAAQIQQNYSSPEDYFPTAIFPERLRLYSGILERLEATLGAKGRLLDVGCGRGELLHVAQRLGWEAEGIDASEAFVRFARETFGVRARAANGLELDLEDASYDAICIVSVLDCVQDPKALMLKLHRALKPGGVIFIETMNNEGLLYRLGDLYYRMLGKRITIRLSPTFPGFQIYGFSRRSMPCLLESSGFRLVRMEVWGGIGSMKKRPYRGLRDFILRMGVMAALLIALAVGQGQVLNTIAKKD